MTDTIVRLALLYFAVRGFCKGFLQTLIPPASLLIGLITSFYVYIHSKSIFKAVLVSIICPIVINLLLSLSLKFWKTTFSQETSPSWGSRMAGALISVFWSGIYLALVLILIAVLPLPFQEFKALQHNVTESQSYEVVKKFTQNVKPLAALNTKDVFETLRDPAKTEKLRQTEEFRQLENDETFKKFLSDPEIATQLQNQDINSLINHPRLQSLLQDKDLLKKILALNRRILEEKNQAALNVPAEEKKP